MSKKIILFVLSTFFCLLITEGLLQCTKFFAQKNQNFSQKTNENDFVIITLGESTTAAGEKDSWPSQLELLLTKNSPDKNIHVINKATVGTNSSVLVGNLEKQMQNFIQKLLLV